MEDRRAQEIEGEVRSGRPGGRWPPEERLWRTHPREAARKEGCFAFPNEEGESTQRGILLEQRKVP